MRVRYAATDALPGDVAVALVEGESQSTVLIAGDATGWEIADALQDVIGEEWVPTSWIYVGRCASPGLKAV